MAGTERIHRQKPSKVQVPAIQSSSVPSTPHQHARDVRFPSRSPSPGRNLLSRAPTLQTPDTNGRQYPERTAPVVCKFETGAEFRKRRIPYKDGGNELLPSPSQEPKKALEPHEEDKLSGDMRELYDRLLPTDESEVRRAKLVEKLERILNEEWPGNDITVNVFGSSGNLLSSSDSDVDICITTTFKKLESMHGLATVLHRHGMERVVCRAAAKVPIVKAWDPELQLACDMNVNNTLALENTRMIKTYVQIDDRVRPLAKIIKYWTKQRILNDAAFGGTISSYTWICMIINFLQVQKPQILPSLQLTDPSMRSTRNGTESQFADNLDKLKGSGKDNKASLGALLFRFFRYYGYELDYQKSVVSVKEGRVLSRKEKGWDPTNYQDKEARVRLCVEEPFNTNRNLGNSADDYAFSGIHEEIRRAFDLIAEGKLDECCAEYVFPPEEKPLFQRPAPKPKPTLTRSASQSGQPGRSHANSVGAKSGGTSRNSRASSSHRANSRRASSGASFGNQRFGFMSPNIIVPGPDYLGAGVKPVPNDQLHEQLYQQYQYLQAQQELLRSQLFQQQQSHAQQVQAQAQAQAQAQIQAQGHSLRTADFSTPSPRRGTFMQGMPSARSVESPLGSAPLLPGYLYHYPARHPQVAGVGPQSRLQEGSMTNPPSPSATSVMSAQRRAGHRGNLQEGAAPAAIRSQSQPGRSFPSPVALQSMAHPGYDVSGAIGTPYLTQQHLQMMQHQQNSYDALARANIHGQQSYDTAIPKEYVGYYMGQSPQLVPQRPMTLQPVPALRDATGQHRQPSPEILPPIMPNGSMRRTSRSPSNQGRRRSSSLTTSSTTKSAPIPQIPFTDSSKPQGQQNTKVTRPIPPSAPGIANGSGIATGATIPPVVNPAVSHEVRKGLSSKDTAASRQSQSAASPTPIQSTKPNIDSTKQEPAVGSLTSGPAANEAQSSKWQALVPQGSPSAAHDSNPEAAKGIQGSPSPNSRARPPTLRTAANRGVTDVDGLSPFTASPAAALTAHNANGNHLQQSPPHPAPLLSPVAELQTPSPTSSRGQNSPLHRTNSSHDAAATRAAAVAAVAAKNAQMANGKPNERAATGPTNGTVSAWSSPLSLLGSTSSVPKPQAPSPSIHVRNENASAKAQANSPSQSQSPPSKSANTTGHEQQPRAPGQGEWQQAVRKHKKGRSLGSAAAMNAATGGSKEFHSRSGEIMPTKESERKGG